MPGGRSSSRYSSSPQATSSRNCWIALWSIGPRQTTAAFSSTKKPIDITLTPPARVQRQDLALAVDLRLAVDAEHARDRVAVDVAVERARPGGLRRSAPRPGWRSSSTCRRRPCRRRRRSRSSPGPARPAAACRGRASAGGCPSPRRRGRRSRPRPRSRRRAAETCWATACSKWERIGQPAVVSETTTSTRPPSLTSIERTMPSSTIERRSSGSMTARSFSVIWSLVGSGIGPFSQRRRRSGSRGERSPPPALSPPLPSSEGGAMSGTRGGRRPDRRAGGRCWR